MQNEKELFTQQVCTGAEQIDEQTGCEDRRNQQERRDRSETRAQRDDDVLTDERMVMNQIHAETAGYEQAKQGRAAAKAEPCEKGQGQQGEDERGRRIVADEIPMGQRLAGQAVAERPKHKTGAGLNDAGDGKQHEKELRRKSGKGIIFPDVCAKRIENQKPKGVIAAGRKERIIAHQIGKNRKDQNDASQTCCRFFTGKMLNGHTYQRSHYETTGVCGKIPILPCEERKEGIPNARIAHCTGQNQPDNCGDADRIEQNAHPEHDERGVFGPAGIANVSRNQRKAIDGHLKNRLEHDDECPICS